MDEEAKKVIVAAINEYVNTNYPFMASQIESDIPGIVDLVGEKLQSAGFEVKRK